VHATHTEDGMVAATRKRARDIGFSDLLARGVVAGLAAGFVFILANMIYATSQGMPAIAPFFRSAPSSSSTTARRRRSSTR
jgi:hypothetical protein